MITEGLSSGISNRLPPCSGSTDIIFYIVIYTMPHQYANIPCIHFVVQQDVNREDIIYKIHVHNNVKLLTSSEELNQTKCSRPNHYRNKRLFCSPSTIHKDYVFQFIFVVKHLPRGWSTPFPSTSSTCNHGKCKIFALDEDWYC